MNNKNHTLTLGEREAKASRFLEIIPGALVWLALTSPIVLSFFYPTWVAYFIIVFDLFWLFKAFYMSRNLLNAYSRMIIEQKTNWIERLPETLEIEKKKKTVLEEIKEKEKSILNRGLFRPFAKFLPKYKKEAKQTRYLYSFLEEISNVKQSEIINWQDIYHLVILATYQEDISILRDSIKAVKNSNFSSKKIMFVLAGEERDQERFQKYAQELKEEFKDSFYLFISTIHPKDIPGEVKGKGGNITYAAKETKKIIDELGLDYKNIIVTTLDADNIVHPEYFASLTYRYVINPHRRKRSFQPVPIFNNNIWDVPAPVRIVASSNGFWQLIESTRPERLRNFSSHAQSFDALVDTDFWATNTIVEDGHQYWRSFFTYDGNYEVVPMFLPIYQDAVQEKTFLKTLKAQYVQLRRWAWGASDFPYVVLNLSANNKIPWWKKIVALYRMMEGYFFWATASLFITIVGWLPGLINPTFNYTLVAFNLPMITSTLMTIAMFGIFINIMISILLLPKRPGHYGKIKHVFMGLQWILMPLVTIFFSSIPAIEAQTRLMIGRRLDWKVTKKVRTNK